ncbi:toxin [Halarcobacter ebronensis]|uniref:Toxin n=1 Tax=Halarcobacter ebronensis TaxID=1462615 RepID=A0A4Q0YBR8_9BACT|nr:BrnT family toxin [Halarcobacter ebronensis]RXJ66984.1 toxin [Halarcobacter ebronensis]
MIFEYDKNKSNSNKSKHNIDFEEAKELWSDNFAIELKSKNCEDEDRYLVIGKIKTKIYAAIITYRGEKIRIISVRRARKKEEELYESVTNR